MRVWAVITRAKFQILARFHLLIDRMTASFNGSAHILHCSGLRTEYTESCGVVHGRRFKVMSKCHRFEDSERSTNMVRKVIFGLAAREGKLCFLSSKNRLVYCWQ